MPKIRISKSAIDWAKLMGKVPPDQKGQFLAFKGKSEVYLRRVLVNPVEAPKIDWERYKKIVPVPGLVDKLQSEYSAFKVPYPEDTLSKEVDAQWAKLQPEIDKFCAEMQKNIDFATSEVLRLEALPAFDNMTMETYYTMCPEQAIDFVNKPSFWPHCPDEQMGWVDPTAQADSGH